MRITLVISSLGCGGAERVVSLLARGFGARGHPVAVVTTAYKEDFFELPPGTPRVALDLIGRSRRPGDADPPTAVAAWRALRTLPRLREAILGQQPDVVISFMDQTNVVVLAALLGTGLPVVVSEHSDPARRPLAMAWKLSRRLFYPRARRLVSVSRGVGARFDWLPEAKRVTIHNPVEIDGRDEPPPELPGRLRRGGFAVAMGRLNRAKGFDLLLGAIAALHRKGVRLPLAILGDGPEREMLERQADELGVAGEVVFLGRRRNPFVYLEQAAFFVLSSRWEGFGNALVEAMASGLPAVSFDCPSGPSEIVEDGVNGLLVPPGEVEALAAAMRAMWEETERRRLMGDRARQTAERFSLDRIVGDWEREVLAR